MEAIEVMNPIQSSSGKSGPHTSECEWKADMKKWEICAVPALLPSNALSPQGVIWAVTTHALSSLLDRIQTHPFYFNKPPGCTAN